ncbi:MAG: RluA family pseudouridine synthase [Calditrichia bacterium]
MAKKSRKSPKKRGPSLIKIIYEDDDIIVIDKPAGLLSVPIPRSRAVNARDILVDYLKDFKQKAIIVHRIDRYTSGLMVFAKNRQAHGNLVKQFLAHTPHRIYLALVRGCPEPAEGELCHYLKQTNWGFRQVVVKNEEEGGTLSVTRYRVVEAFPDAALLEIYLVTGLKNQIRVQLNAAGHPIVGDRHYSEKEKKATGLDRQALHAHRLGFVHPATGKYVEFKSELPADMRKKLNEFRKQKSDK